MENTQITENKLNWINKYEIESPRYAEIRDGFATSCAALTPTQSLADAIADYKATYDNNGEEGTTHCRAALIEDGEETQVEQFDFTISFPESVTPATASLRSTARQSVIDAVSDRAAYEHERNYRKLHVYRDGDVHWTEHINQSDDVIDSGAKHFAAVPSVACVGTGSCACNCDHCSNVGPENPDSRGDYYDSPSEAIADAVMDSDLSSVEADMLEAFDAIPAGYFDDEDEDAA